MPLYMDVHWNVPRVSPDAVAEAHRRELEVQARHGVQYLMYWHSESDGSVFRLVLAPSTEAVDRVHREANGLPTDEIVEVKEVHCTSPDRTVKDHSNRISA